jgi:hypothetical protein
MSINTAHANNGVLIHSGECILLFSDNVVMEFSGQDSPMFKGNKYGRIYLTTHRMIFNSKKQTDQLQSFSFPFVTLSDVEVEQPVFSANFIRGKVRAQHNGGWTGEAKFKLHFKSGGAIDFGQAMLRAASMAQRNAGNNFAPPPYTPPSSSWYAAPPPAYTPTPGNYGWIPQGAATAFPDAPPNDGVFMTDNPPPYPGINPNYQPGPNAQGAAGGSHTNGYGFQQPSGSSSNMGFNIPPMSKEQEAAQSAYYDPNRPSTAFVPPPAYYENPPSYESSVNNSNNKKTQ